MRIHRISAVVLVLALLMFGFPPPSLCFEFDVWRSGMRLSEILETARANDLPIAATSYAHIQKHYNDELARKDAGKHRSYKYETKLLGWPATVTLQLTPYGRELHTVEVAIHLPLASQGDRERLETNMVDILSRKYGAFTRPAPENVGEAIFRHRAKQWSPNKTDRVAMDSRTNGETYVRYVDLRLKTKGELEEEALRDRQAEQGRAQDGGRF